MLLSVPAWFIVTMTATSRAMSQDARDPVTIAFAHAQGATSVLAWVTDNDLGGSIFLLTDASFLVGLLTLLGAAVALAIRRNPQGPPGTARPPSAPPARGT